MLPETIFLSCPPTIYPSDLPNWEACLLRKILNCPAAGSISGNYLEFEQACALMGCQISQLSIFNCDYYSIYSEQIRFLLTTD